MKLAEALQERADLNKKIEQLRSRITSNALMQEGVLRSLASRRSRTAFKGT